MFEMIMMSLRMKEGLSKQAFRDRFAQTVEETWPQQIKTMCAQGLLVHTVERLYCTERGFELLNEILVEFLA